MRANSSGAWFLRRRLVELLDAMEGGSLVYLSAGAGYGKSTLLEQWAATSRRPVALARLTAADDERSRLEMTLARAVATVVPEAAALVERASGPDPDRACSCLPPLLRLMSAHDVALVVDDLHHLTSSSSRDLVRLLADRWVGPGVLVLADRARPPIRLVRSDLDRPTRIIDEATLAFDAHELSDLAHRASPWTAPAVSNLLDSTVGWPAGIRLAAVAELRDRPISWSIPGGDLSNFILSYALEGLTEDEVEFVSHVAWLTPGSAAVIDRTLNRNDTLSVLRDLQQRGARLITLPDDDAGSITVHTLLADVLRERLLAHEPARVQELLTRGARLERTGPSDQGSAPPPAHVVARISTAELRVLHYLPSHYSLPRIAAELNLAASTVKTHCLAVYRKLGVDNRDDAVTTARRLGLIRD